MKCRRSFCSKGRMNDSWSHSDLSAIYKDFLCCMEFALAMKRWSKCAGHCPVLETYAAVGTVRRRLSTSAIAEETR